MASNKLNGVNVREESLRVALEIIQTAGLESLSLREVARRLGISHQAPYKHFPSRDHLLAEVIRRVFEGFISHLEAQASPDDPHHALQQIGQVYLTYAMRHPLEYRLMFNTPLPDPQAHPAMMHSARRAFDLLATKLDQLPFVKAQPDSTLDVLFIWATMHGLASILQTRALDTLALPDDLLAQAVPHLMERLQAALR